GLDSEEIESALLPVSILHQKLADANNDGTVTIKDFSSLMSNWNKIEEANVADFDEDGKVGIMDFSILMSNWGR
ncbi:MAG: dockerin type I domain-containing protein, partial [Proteobacteria bacterium]|nr:dockerin type I domain-containing protein [Pseudomonadota bacterium]